MNELPPITSWKPSTIVGYAIDAGGFVYVADQDIVTSRRDALQRDFGYAYGYDQDGDVMSFDIDCEPFFFEYDGREWMIELWKGQYGVATGCEIGVYNRSPNPPAFYHVLDDVLGPRPGDAEHSKYYACAGDDDMLEMSYVLRRDGVTQFRMERVTHWWLTGFRFGLSSRPTQLTMEVTIRFKDGVMAAAFVTEATRLGYLLHQEGAVVSFTFDRPATPQPPRTPATLAAVRATNDALVATFAAAGLPNRDPNGTPIALWLAVGMGAHSRSIHAFSSILLDALRRRGNAAPPTAPRPRVLAVHQDGSLRHIDEHQSHWRHLDVDVSLPIQQAQSVGDLIAFVAGEGHDLYAMPGESGKPVYQADKVLNFQLTDRRIGYQNLDGAMTYKEGSLTAEWTPKPPQYQFDGGGTWQMTSDRLAFVDQATGELSVKTASWDDEWVKIAPSVKQFSVDSSTILYLTHANELFTVIPVAGRQPELRKIQTRVESFRHCGSTILMREADGSLLMRSAGLTGTAKIADGVQFFNAFPTMSGDGYTRVAYTDADGCLFTRESFGDPWHRLGPRGVVRAQFAWDRSVLAIPGGGAGLYELHVFEGPVPGAKRLAVLDGVSDFSLQPQEVP